MQNHLEISSKTQFWTRTVRNLSKSLTESLCKVYGIFQDLSRRTHKGPYGPQPGPVILYIVSELRCKGWNRCKGWGPVRVGARSGLGPIEPLWAHMGPYGSSWTGLGRFRRFRKLYVNFPSDFWTNFARFGSKTEFLMKFLTLRASPPARRGQLAMVHVECT